MKRRIFKYLEQQSRTDAKKGHCQMLQRVEFNPHTYYRKPPKAEEINPASAFRTQFEALSGEALTEHNNVLIQRTMEQLEAMGKDVTLFKVALGLIKPLPEMCMESSARAQDALQGVFGVQMENINVSPKVLSRMGQDSDLFQEIVDTIQNALNHITELKQNYGNAKVVISVSEHGILYGLIANIDQSSQQQSAVKMAFEKMIEAMGTRYGPLFEDLIFGRA